MNITNQNQINFSSNVYLKQASDIQRIGKRAFPMLSSTYIRDSYLLSQKNSSKKGNYAFFIKNLFFLRQKVNLFRDIRLFMKFDSVKTEYQELFEAIKDIKAGNCTEKSEVTLAALYANGFENSKIQNVFVETSVLDKVTKKEETTNILLDHNVVMSDMNKDGVKKTQDYFFLDPWIDFCSSYSGMVEKYKVYFEKQIKKSQNSNLKILNQVFGEDVTSNKRYRVSHKIVFKDDPNRRINFDFKNIKKLVQENYPELILKTKSDK